MPAKTKRQLQQLRIIQNRNYSESQICVTEEEQRNRESESAGTSQVFEENQSLNRSSESTGSNQQCDTEEVLSCGSNLEAAGSDKVFDYINEGQIAGYEYDFDYDLSDLDLDEHSDVEREQNDATGSDQELENVEDCSESCSDCESNCSFYSNDFRHELSDLKLLELSDMSMDGLSELASSSQCKVQDCEYCESNDAASNDEEEQEEAELPPPVKKRRKIPSHTQNAHDFVIHDDAEWQPVDGNRIIEPDYFLRCIFGLVNNHLQNCCKPNFVLESESYKAMLSIFLVRCKTCGKRFTIRSENPEHKDSIRKSAVWATIAAGETHSHSEEFLAHMDIPFMCFSAFENIEHCIYDIVQPLSVSLMEEAIEDEKKLAKFHDEDGTPGTTVVVDGSWPVRSYGSKYTSRSGAAVIFGLETGKVLFADTRNTFCLQCYYNDKNGVNKKHKCFLNYSGSPGAIEVDVLLSGLGFMLQKGLKARIVCGDDDSSAFDNMKDRLPYGEEIRKAQCINHKLKNFKKRLINATGKSNNDIPCCIMRTLINPICAGARGAINHCKAGGGVDIEGLAHDLENLLNHNVGIHKDCRRYFCDKQDENDYSMLNTLKENEALFNTVQGLLHELALDADRLCFGLNTNWAENFMSVIAKFTLGKRLSLCNRGSYSLRVLFAVCSVNKGYGWAKEVLQKFTRRAVSSTYVQYFESRDRTRAYTKDYHNRSDFRRNVTKKFIEEHDYGPSVQNQGDMAIDGPAKKAEFEEFYPCMIAETEIRENTTESQVLKFMKGRIFVSYIPDVVYTKNSANLPKKSNVCSSNSNNEKTMRKIWSVHKVATEYIKKLGVKKFSENLVIIHHLHPMICLFINGRSDDKQSIFMVRRRDVFRKKQIFLSLRDASNGSSSLGFKIDGDIAKPDRNHLMEAQIAMHLSGAVKCFILFVNGGSKKDIVHVCIDADPGFMEKSVNTKLDRFIDDYFVPQLVEKSIRPEELSKIK